MFYETHRFSGVDIFYRRDGENMSFSEHLHRHIEIIFLKSGKMNLTINSKSFELTENKCAFIPSNFVHSYESKENNEYTIYIFSPELIGKFYSFLQKKIPDNYIFNFQIQNLNSLKTDDNLYTIKGVLYLICGEYIKSTKFNDINKNSLNNESLIKKCIDYIDFNFTENISMKTMSQNLGYDYKYLSKYFRQTTNFTFNEYLNQRRIDLACYLLTDKGLPISEIGERCAYETLRTFDRNFIKSKGISPRMYREKYL